jgi:hypothetical protein
MNRVGGSDSQNGTPGNTAEDNFIIDDHGAPDATVDRRRTRAIGDWIKGKDQNPGTLTGRRRPCGPAIARRRAGHDPEAGVDVAGLVLAVTFQLPS